MRKSSASNGRIEVICGSMFSGKTEELIKRLRSAEMAELKIQVFKPASDTRYDENAIVSHNATSVPCTPVDHSSAILLFSGEHQVIGIDEAQFFDDELPEVCTKLANSGIRVIVAGLDMDFSGKPFGPVPQLMAIAEEVTKVQAVCATCSEPALYSYRLIENDSTFLLGEMESYEPRCRTCYWG